MKAEQRKELETNTLADKMGHVMQRVRSSPRRTFVTYLIIAIAVLIAAFFAYRWYAGGKVQASYEWLLFYDGARNNIEGLASEKGDQNTGKAALFEVAWFSYWDGGIKMLGSDKDAAMKNLERASRMYEALAQTCKDDPVFEPQALLGWAVAEESRAVQERSHLDRAKEHYEALTKIEKYEKSAEAKFARARLEILNDPAKKADLARTYEKLQEPDMLGIPPPLPLQRGILPGFKAPPP